MTTRVRFSIYVLEQNPYIPQFRHIKVGYKGVYITGTCYPDVYLKRVCILYADMHSKT